MHTDYLKYFPITVNSNKEVSVQPTSLKMRALPEGLWRDRQPNNRFFQIDDQTFHHYRETKIMNRKRGLRYFYQALSSADRDFFGKLLLSAFLNEYPGKVRVAEGRSEIIYRFLHTSDVLVMESGTNNPIYASIQMDDSTDDTYDIFDCMCMQIPEDIVVFSYDEVEKRTFASIISLMIPNGWSASATINKSFDAIHKELTTATGSSLFPENTFDYVKKICDADKTFERVGAISFQNDEQLSRHPGLDKVERDFNPDKPNLHMRFERQTITGYPDKQSFLFTIRTYMHEIAQSTAYERELFARAFANQSQRNVYSAEYIQQYREEIINWITSL